MYMKEEKKKGMDGIVLFVVFAESSSFAVSWQQPRDVISGKLASVV